MAFYQNSKATWKVLSRIQHERSCFGRKPLNKDFILWKANKLPDVRNNTELKSNLRARFPWLAIVNDFRPNAGPALSGPVLYSCAPTPREPWCSLRALTLGQKMHLIACYLYTTAGVNRRQKLWAWYWSLSRHRQKSTHRIFRAQMPPFPSIDVLSKIAMVMAQTIPSQIQRRDSAM